jgi:glycosyltransferase involved in cell wall biosynthesis
MKVVVLAYAGYPDQGATYFYEMTQALASLGQQVTALALRRDGEAMCEQLGGARVKRVAPKIAYRQVGKLAFFRAAARSIRTEQPDVVHCYSTLGLWALRRLAGSGQVWVHEIQSAAVTGWHPAVNWVENRLRARQSRVFDFTVVVAPSVAHKLFGGQSAQVSVLPAGVNLDRFSPVHRRDLRPTLGVPSDAVLACYIGALHGTRRLDIMIRAVAHAMAASSTLHVVVIGNGPDRSRLEALASSLAPGRFVFLGYRPYTELPVYMASSDIGLSFLPPGPTFDDQPPLKVMEYLASGLPTVATAIPGHEALIQQGVNGLLSKATSEAFGHAITLLASDKVLRGTLRDRCRNSIAHRDWRIIVGEQLLPIYTRLLSEYAEDRGRASGTSRKLLRTP